MPDSLEACGREMNPQRKSYGFKNIRIRVDVASLGRARVICSGARGFKSGECVGQFPFYF